CAARVQTDRHQPRSHGDVLVTRHRRILANSARLLMHRRTFSAASSANLERTMRLNRSLLAALLLSAPCASFASDSPALKAYTQLKGLVGTWKATDPKNPTSIDVKLIANESAIVETWTMSPTRQSMTVFTMD